MEILREYWELYKRDLKTSVREISYVCYTGSINRSFQKIPWILDKKVQDISEEDIIFAKEILKKFYTSKTIYRFLILIKKLLNIAIKMKIIDRNVVENIKLPKSEYILNTNVISVNNFRNILKEVEKMRTINVSKGEIILFLKLLFKTGLRHSEARALRWQDINFSTSKISVTHSLYCFTYSEFKLTDTKTKSSRRTISIDKNLINELKEYKKTRVYSKNNDFVFCGKDGKPRISEFGKYHLNKAAKILGLKITTHGLRHSHASFLLKNKVNILLISKRLGHSSVEMTLKIYCHLMEENETEIINLMEDI